MTLPPINQLVEFTDADQLVEALSLLLERSPPLSNLLVPRLLTELHLSQDKPKSYSELLTLAEEIVASWDIQDQAAFIEAHPRIGETNNLSALSGAEQGGQTQTPGEVLKRLGVSADLLSCLCSPSAIALSRLWADAEKSGGFPAFPACAPPAPSQRCPLSPILALTPPPSFCRCSTRCTRSLTLACATSLS